jgi:hypothetical protein
MTRAAHLVSEAGDEDRGDVNALFLQLFLPQALGQGGPVWDPRFVATFRFPT